MGVGDHMCVLIENQRWSIRHRTYRNDALIAKVDPPAFCTEEGLPSSMEAINRETERSQTNRRPGSAIKPWRWKEPEWRSRPWEYAVAFQSTFKKEKNRTHMVRRRYWTRVRVTIRRELHAKVGSAGAAAAVNTPPPDANAPGQSPPLAHAATPTHEHALPPVPTDGATVAGAPTEVSLPTALSSVPSTARTAATADRSAVIRFASDTVYDRALDNRRWRATASSRAAPQWTRQYFDDCVTCEVDPLRSVAAFLAVNAVSVYERQTKARLVLGGKAPWPEDSPMTAVLAAGEELYAMSMELQDQLIRDMAKFGQAEAIPMAERDLVFAAANALTRVNRRRDQRAEANSGGDAAAAGGGGDVDGVTDNHSVGTADGQDGGRLAGGHAPRRASYETTVSKERIDSFIAQTLSELQINAPPSDGGYDTADGWFVLDEDLDVPGRGGRLRQHLPPDDPPDDESEPEDSRSRRARETDGNDGEGDDGEGDDGNEEEVSQHVHDQGDDTLDTDDAMFQSATEVDGSIVTMDPRHCDGSVDDEKDVEEGMAESVYYDTLDEDPSVDHDNEVDDADDTTTVASTVQAPSGPDNAGTPSLSDADVNVTDAEDTVATAARALPPSKVQIQSEIRILEDMMQRNRGEASA
eukprot:m.169000 g.169000  ORF g.169000 m.169000 type:complete len:639 (-) comp13036_c0_seq1:82-1998(-)